VTPDIDDATLERACHRLARALAPPAHVYVALRVDGHAAGWIRADRVERLTARSDVFHVNSDGIAFLPALRSAQQRSAAVADVARELAAEGALTAWRDERYAATPAFGAPPWFELERAAARYFGVRTYAAHANGLVRDAGGVTMWIARRSPAKAIDPGLLDNLVGGGIAAGATVAATLVKEAWEEAGIPAALATKARLASRLHIRRDQPDGLQRETIFVHDLWLPAGFVPTNQDGEAVEHRRVALREAAVLAGNEVGGDVMTADASLVALDALLRHAAITHGGAWRQRLAALAHRED
jgi:8-oxo-dGTP pyrophosphatase MutT (NUDIX family)